MHPINVDVVTRLIAEQFPEWASFTIKPVKHSGHDNRTFHLGEQMSVRLPSAASYVPQVEKEQRWLPVLSKELTLPISTPIAKGEPSEAYPWSWSVNQWVEGEALSLENVTDLNQLATDLGTFLLDLQSIDASGGPLAGEHNFYRDGSIAVYDEATRSAIDNNKDIFNELLLKDGQLCAVIDFGILGVGDPAYDAAMAWTFFDDKSRKIFKNTSQMDEETRNRARGWALWKALITYDAQKVRTRPLRKNLIGLLIPSAGIGNARASIQLNIRGEYMLNIFLLKHSIILSL